MLRSIIRYALLCFVFSAPTLLSAQSSMLDTSFADNGLILIEQGGYAELHGTAITPNGKIMTAIVDNGQAWLFRHNLDGQPNGSFGVQGKLSIDFNGGYLSIQPDGKMLLHGTVLFGDQGQLHGIGVLRLNEDGGVDSTFGQNGLTATQIGIYSEPSELKVQPDGKILTLSRSNFGLGLEFSLCRFTTEGMLDTSFSENGIAHNGFFHHDGAPAGMVLQPDGKVLVFGSTVGLDNTYRDMAIARYKTDGSLDSSFAINGEFTYHLPGFIWQFANGLAVMTDGKILGVGNLNHSSIEGETCLFRLLPDGTPDPSFGNGGFVTGILEPQYFGSLLTLLPDGKICVAGTRSLAANPPVYFRSFVAQFLPNGDLDTDFTQGGVGELELGEANYPRFFVPMPDGSSLLAGQEQQVADAIPIRTYLAKLQTHEDLTNTSQPAPDFQVSIHPNPIFGGQASFNLNMAKHAEVTAYLSDIQGNKLKTILPKTSLPSGSHLFRFELKDYPSGPYFIVVSDGLQTSSLKIIRQ